MENIYFIIDPCTSYHIIVSLKESHNAHSYEIVYWKVFKLFVLLLFLQIKDTIVPSCFEIFVDQNFIFIFKIVFSSCPNHVFHNPNLDIHFSISFQQFLKCPIWTRIECIPCFWLIISLIPLFLVLTLVVSPRLRLQHIITIKMYSINMFKNIYRNVVNTCSFVSVFECNWKLSPWKIKISYWPQYSIHIYDN